MEKWLEQSLSLNAWLHIPGGLFQAENEMIEACARKKQLFALHMAY